MPVWDGGAPLPPPQAERRHRFRPVFVGPAAAKGRRERGAPALLHRAQLPPADLGASGGRGPGGGWSAARYSAVASVNGPGSSTPRSRTATGAPTRTGTSPPWPPGRARAGRAWVCSRPRTSGPTATRATAGPRRSSPRGLECAAGPPHCRRHDRRPRPGTINIVLAVPAPLTDAALVNAVATATEAKVQALLDAGFDCSGTPTDAVCVAAHAPRPGEEPHAFAGPRSLWGSRLARAVHTAVRDAAGAHY